MLHIEIKKTKSFSYVLFVVSFMLMGLFNATAMAGDLATGSYVFADNAIVLDSCSAYFEGTSNVLSCRDGEVPTPAATWLFILSLVAFVCFSNKRKL